jgi:hypothetical protein
MSSFLSALKSLFVSAGSAVDAAVPVSTGNRTVATVLVGAAAQTIPALLPFIPPPYGPAIMALIPVITQVVAILTPVFAAAHVARAVAPAKS